MWGRPSIFLGPTLARAQAAELLDAEFLPPVEQGSIVRLVAGDRRPAAIVIIDGAFAKVPAVRHKEILWALSRGVPVLGAASMGALRAAELFRFGMLGHGLIYRWFRATPLLDDDEVAVAMTPAELGAKPLSEALINIRMTLRKAERWGVVPRRMRLALEEVASSIHFLDRTYQNLFDVARGVFPGEWAGRLASLAKWATEYGVDQKREDAVSLLRWLAGRSAPVALQAAAQAPFQVTEAWLADLEAAGLSLDGG